MEPRLLLSGSVHESAIQALHDNLLNLETLLGGAETTGPLSHAFDLVTANGATSAGAIANLHNVFDADVVQALATEISNLGTGAAPITSTQLASDLTTIISSTIGTLTGDSVTVTDSSTASATILTFAIAQTQTASFDLNLGATGTKDGLDMPDSVGNSLVSTTHFSFTTTVNDTLPDGAGIATSQNYFSLSNASFGLGLHATAALAGKEFDVGLLQFTVDSSAAPLDVMASYHGAITNLSGATLATDAAAVSDGNLSSLQGSASAITVTVTQQTAGTTDASPLADIPLVLTADSTIPGIAPITTPVHLYVTGTEGAGDAVVDDSHLAAGLQTATADPDFAVPNLNTFLPGDLASELGKIGTAIDHLSAASGLGIAIPFTSGVTVGQVINVATALKTLLIDPLSSTVGALGFTEGQTNTASANFIESAVLTATQIANLPQTISLELSFNNGKVSALEFAPTYVDANGHTQNITSVANLVTALNQSIASSALAGYVAASDDAGRIDFVLTTPPAGSSPAAAATSVTVTSPQGVSLFSNLRSFGIQLATLLHLPGYDDTTDDPETVGDTLLAELGLAYDPTTNAVTFSISHQFDLPTLSAPFSVNLDLGSVANLAVSNATFSLIPSVFLNLTVGLSLNPLGSDVNQPGGPQIGDGTDGTPDVAINALPVYTQAANGGKTPITADQIAGTTGLSDIEITNRLGQTATLEILPSWTLSNFENAVYALFPQDPLVVSYNGVGNHEIDIADNGPAYVGPAPAALGLTVNTLASAAAVAGISNDYQAVLHGTAPTGTIFNGETKFLIELGSLAPILVDATATQNTAAGFASAINSALSHVSIDSTKLGLPAADTLHASNLLTASVDSSGGIALTSTVYNAIKSFQSAGPTTAAQIAAVQSGITVAPLALTIQAQNGSFLPGLLGITGSDSNPPGADQGLIIGAPLDGETLADRLLIENTGITATIDMSLVPTDPDNPIGITGALGPLGFSGSLDPAGAYVSLQAALLLNDSANAVPNVVTLHQFTTALSLGNLSSLLALSLQSGRPGQPFAELDITGIALSAGGIDLTSASSPEIIVSLDNPQALLSLAAPTPSVVVNGFSPTIAAGDIVGALSQVLNSLDSSLANTTIPLVDVSLEDILGFASNVISALTDAQADPAGTIAAVQTDINDALGGNYVTLSQDTHHNLIVAFDYTPVAVQTTLPFNLDLSQLASLTGSSALQSVAAAVGDVASASASGQINVTAGVTVALTLGVNLGANNQPAQLTDLVSQLNDKKGLITGTAGQPDLQVTFANGKSFKVDVGALPATATVANLLTLLNTAASGVGVANFATYNATTGALTLNDPTANTPDGLSQLGMTAPSATLSATTERLTGTTALAASKAGDSYAFEMQIGNGVSVEVDVAANAARTTAASLLSAIQSAMNTTLVNISELTAENANVQGGTGAAGPDSTIVLGELVRASLNTQGHLVFSVSTHTLGTTSTGAPLNFLGVAASHPQSTFAVTSLNGSHIAQDLGLSSDAASITNTAAARSLGGTLTEPGTSSQRFFVETGTGAGGALLTGVTATLGISAQTLDFTAGIGPLVANVVGGTAELGLDTGKHAAGTTGFAVGDPGTAPALFSFGLNDSFDGGTAGSGQLTFAQLAKLGTTGNSLANLIDITADAALSVNLPVQIYGVNLTPAITLQVGNLFNSTTVPGLPARSVSTTVPSFSNINVASILDDPQALIDGLDAFLSTLSGGSFAHELYGLNLPLIGPALQSIGGFFSDLHNDVVGTLQSDLNQFIAANPGVQPTTVGILTAGLNQVFGELGLQSGEVYSYIDSLSAPTEVGFVFSFSKILFSGTASLSGNLGIPGLGLDLQNAGATVTAALNATLAFGYKTGVGFFLYDIGTPAALTSFTPNTQANDPTFDFATSHALDLGIAVSLPASFSASLNLGILTATAVNGTTFTAQSVNGTITGTSLTGDLVVNIGPNDSTGRLPFSAFGSQPLLQAYVLATLNVDLALVTGFGTGSVSAALPTISTEILFSYTYFDNLVGPAPAGLVSGVVTPLTLMNVSLNVGTFLTNFLEPIINDVEQVIAPLEPILNFLTEPLPGLSQIVGPTSVLDLAQEFGGPTVQSAVTFIKVVSEIASLASSLEALSSVPGGLMLDFGNFVLAPLTSAQLSAGNYYSLSATKVDPASSATAVSGTDVSNALTAAQLSAFTTMGNSVLARPGAGSAGATLGGLATSNTGANNKTLINLPILHNPLAIVEMLLGQTTPADLIEITLPVFKFSFSKDLAFHFLIGPVPAEVDFFASVSAQIALGFGFDTSGIIRFESSGNPLDIFDGFYVQDNAPQLVFSATFGVNAGIDLVLVAAGIGGEITGTIDFQLADPQGAGKVYASTLLQELETDPLHIFDIHGELDALVYAWYWVGIDVFIGKITLYQGQFNLIGPLELLSFSYDYSAAHSTPVLAESNDGTVALNLGINADQQENGGNLANPDQNFTIQGTGDGAFNVVSNGTTAAYTGDMITASLGDGNNNLTFNNLNGADVAITGGNGNDMINLSGVTSDPTVTLGDGNNIIYGAKAPTTITVGNGQNTIYAGAGRTTIFAGSGNNTIIGGTGADVIVVGSGNNTIEGGSGGNRIIAGGGNNTIWGGAGGNVISIAGGDGDNIIFGTGGPIGTVITSTMVVDHDTATNEGNATIIGGDGNDIIFGGNGNNTITGGAGNDVIFGATGTLLRNAAGAVVTATDISSIGGNNVIDGGSGDTFIIGGAGANRIDTGSGNDEVLGNDGTLQGSAGGSAQGFTMTGLNGVGGNDIITTGVGNDVVIAGHGANTITGGPGNDVFLGHEGTVTRTAASGRNAALLSATITDLGGGGNDLIVTGTGSDVVIAGAGNNIIHAGAQISAGVYGHAGLDVLLGGFGTVTATDPATGSGSVDQSWVVTGQNGAAAGTGNATITTDNTAIIMGGGGNNSITSTEGTLGSDVVFGANGRVMFDTLLLGGIKVHTAGTVAGEEMNGGNNVIAVGNGRDEVFGGAGNSTITAGNGNDVILGHLGLFNADRLAAPTPAGIAPDVTGFYLGQNGQALRSTGDVITAGNGNDVILGGAGNNRITAGTGTDIVFGAAGIVTRNGPANNALLVAQTTEESLAGNNTITAGLNSLAADVVFGGGGTNVISVGNGNNIVLGHLGVVNLVSFTYSSAQRSTGARPDIISRTLPEIGAQVAGEPFPTAGLDTPLRVAGSTITAGSGNNMILGGAGSNSITAGNGNNTIFGASGAITRDATTLGVMLATTTEEQYGGNDMIVAGQGNNTIFGGIGTNRITVGDRTNVIFGHLGEMDAYNTTLYTAAQRAQGADPDLIGRTLPEIGNITPNTAGGRAGLDRYIATTGSTIIAGNGNNIIMGGAGNNTIITGIGQDIVFGASGAVTRTPGTLAPVFMETVEEQYGGSDTIAAGLRGNAGDIVFGGIGATNIEVGNGNNIVLGHLGVVDLTNLNQYSDAQRATGSLPDIWARVVPEIGNISPTTAAGMARLNTVATTGNATILAGNGNNVIMGGGGNNTISTGAGIDVVFGAAGAVTRSARTYQVMVATTIEESLGGNDVLNVGNNAVNNDTVFGGAGNDIIAVGNGNNVAFGHLGQVNLYAIEGVGTQGNDILGRTIPVLANISPKTTGPWGGLGVKLNTTGDTITAGNGNNILEGGAGNNTIKAGNGNNVVFGASGSVTRNPTTGAEVSAQETEIGLGGTDTILLGTGHNLVFNTPPSARATTHSTATQTLPNIAAPAPAPHAANTQVYEPHTARILPVVIDTGRAAHPTRAGSVGLLSLAGATPQGTVAAYVLDSFTGQWVPDTDEDDPLLVIDVEKPILALSAANHPLVAAAAA